MEIQVGSKINKLLSSEPHLEIKDEITRTLLELDEYEFPGTRVKCVNSTIKRSISDEWSEYDVLLEIDKYLDTTEYLSFAFKNISKLIKSLDHLNIDSIGIQEFDGGLAGYYYILLYILKK